MKTNKKLTLVTLIFGIITILAVGFSHLALTDIYHNVEPNLSQEWSVVRISLIIITISVILSLITMRKISSTKT